MATAPMKSQPLHNFSLEYLKWGSKNLMNKSSSNRHRHRRLESSSTSQTWKHRRSPPTERRSQEVEVEVEEEEEEHLASSAADSVPSSTRPPKKQFGAAACSASAEKSPKVSKKESDGGKKECAAPAEEGHEKPWNLRPRRAPAVHSAEKSPPSPKQHKYLRLRGSADTQKGPEKKQKKEQDKKLWISLSKDEIERDIFALTGSKPARKPRKRPRTEQKVLDNIFPGLWLAGMTAEAYQAPEAPSKP